MVFIEISLVKARGLFSVQSKPDKTKKTKKLALVPPKTKYTIQFGKKVFESEPVEANAAPEIAQIAKFEFSKDQTLIDALCFEKIEVIVEELNDKGEKLLIGTSYLSVYEFLNGKSEVREWVPVVLPEETIIALSEETDKFEAELELLVSFSSNETSTEKLYNSEELSSYNIFQCCVSAYSIPDKKNITVSIGERSWGFPVKLVQMPVEQVKEANNLFESASLNVSCCVELTRTFYANPEEVGKFVESNARLYVSVDSGVCVIDASHLLRPGSTSCKVIGMFEDPSISDQKGFVVVTLNLSKAIVPKVIRPALSLHDILELKPTAPKVSASDSMAEFRSAVKRVLAQLYSEYKTATFEQQDFRQQFYFYLNSTGIYQSFRERLKGPISKLIREKISLGTEKVRDAAIASRSGIFSSETVKPVQELANPSEIYLLLTEEMHRCLNKMFESGSVIDDVTAVSNASKTAALKHEILVKENSQKIELANELSGLIVSARNLYLDALVGCSNDPDLWHSYALFELRQGCNDTAFSALKRGLIISPSHDNCLITFGGICLETNRLAEAWTVLQSKSGIYYTVLLSLYYLLDEEDEKSNEIWSSINQGENICTQMAQWCIDNRWLKLAQLCLNKENKPAGTTVERALAQFGLSYYAKKSLSETELVEIKNYIKEAREKGPIKHSTLYIVLGELFFKLGDLDSAKSCYEFHLELYPDCSVLGVIATLCGIYFFEKNWTAGKELVLKGIASISMGDSLPAIFWFLAGIASVHLCQWKEAEKAFAQANICDTNNPDIWALLALCAIEEKRWKDADSCMEQAYRLELNQKQLLLIIGRKYKQFGFIDDATKAFQYAETNLSINNAQVKNLYEMYCNISLEGN